jgi:hypothetical protein
MRDHIKKVVVFLVLTTGMIFAFNPVLSSGQNGPKGSIIGFLYDKDGTTPITGGVVTIKNIGSGSMFASTQTDQFGIFKISGVEKGVYVYGVTTPNGTFNSNALMGVRIKDNETAKVSIAVNPYEKNVSEEMREIIQEQKAKGEALVGKVIDYNDNQGMADVYILKGYLEVNQRIHAKGNVTNFYQDVKDLKKEGAVSRRLFAGETATLKIRDKAQPGDLVFLVCKRGVLPLFLAPLGIATIIGGSAAIANDNTPDDEPPAQVSTFKK